MRREIREEMHCLIEVGRQIIATDYEYDFGIVHLTTFYCKLIEGSPILTEHASMKWVYSDELSSLDWAPADIPTVEKLVNAARITNAK